MNYFCEITFFLQVTNVQISLENTEGLLDTMEDSAAAYR